jgi:hypothetical protein
MQPESLPVVPAQPDRDQYGVNAIALFKCYMTPAEYAAAFGEDPPPFDVSLRPKYWFDTSVDLSDPEGEAEYQIVVQDKKTGLYSIRTIHLAVAEAARPNIPSGAAVAGDDDFSRARNQTPREVPIRKLLDNEMLTSSPFGPSIVRTDKKEVIDEAAGRFTASDRALLKAIAAKLGV